MITEPSIITPQVPPVTASNDVQENSTQEHNNQDKTDWNGLSVSTTTDATPILVQGELNSTNEDTSKGAIAIQNSTDTEEGTYLWSLYQEAKACCGNSETVLPSETIHSAVGSEITETPTAIITSDVDNSGNLILTIPVELLEGLQPAGTSLEALVNAAEQAYNQAMPRSDSSGASEVQTNTADNDFKSATSLEEAVQILVDTTCTDASETSSVTSNDSGINLVNKPDHENSTDSVPAGAMTRSRKRNMEQEEVLSFKRFRESMAERAESTETSELLHLPGLDSDTSTFLMGTSTPKIIDIECIDFDQNPVKSPLALPTAPLTQEPQGITENIDQKSDSGISEGSENITNQETTDGNPTKEDRYRIRRDKNNEASRLSRQKRKQREAGSENEIKRLEVENEKLEEKIKGLEQLAKQMNETLTKMIKRNN